MRLARKPGAERPKKYVRYFGTAAALAEKLVKEQGGIPGSRWLFDNGDRGFYGYMQRVPQLFSSFPKLGLQRLSKEQLGQLA